MEEKVPYVTGSELQETGSEGVTILQVTPSLGWYAMYQDPQNQVISKTRVVTWALCEDKTGNRALFGIVALGETGTKLAHEQPGFMKYVYLPGEYFADIATIEKADTSGQKADNRHLYPKHLQGVIYP